MTREEQEKVKSKGYALAMRYLNNAKDVLRNAGREGDDDMAFKDTKYVSSASGIAYRGVLFAVRTWLESKDVKFPEADARGMNKGISIDFYRRHLTKHDKKLLRDLNLVYNDLHLSGYYDCTNSVSTINAGLKIAKDIIERVKPQGVA
ncbi:MAG: DUF5618 family protein [Fibromonadales bacterium]|nr:DUF5618 family protein [Fibromonadales bacterium]